MTLAANVPDQVAAQLAAAVAERLGPDAGSPWLTVEETAAYLKMSPAAVRKAAHRGQLPSYRRGARRLFHRAELDRAVRGEAG